MRCRCPRTCATPCCLRARITAHGGLYRQKQYIGKLMRKIDAEPIRARSTRDASASASKRCASAASSSGATGCCRKARAPSSGSQPRCPSIDVRCGYGLARRARPGKEQPTARRSHPRAASCFALLREPHELRLQAARFADQLGYNPRA